MYTMRQRLIPVVRITLCPRIALERGSLYKYGKRRIRIGGLAFLIRDEKSRQEKTLAEIATSLSGEGEGDFVTSE